jgi:hypothetical protein
MKIAKDVVCDRETNSYGYVGAPLCGVSLSVHLCLLGT